MAAIVSSRCLSRGLLSAAGSKSFRARGATRPYGTSKALNSGRVAVLLGLPALSYVGYQAYRIVQSSSPFKLYALEKEEVLEQADYLYSCGETEKLYELLLQYKDSEEAECLWRLARASRDLSLLPSTSAEQKRQLTFEAFEYAQKALETDEKCFAAHKWYAVCLSDIGDYKGVKGKIGNSYIIRKHLERAVELNPKDATSLHILGYWCFSFAELPWYQRKVAAVIFASPPSSTYEEALAFFLKAEEVDPNFYSTNLVMLGKTYMCLKDRQNALLWLTKARDYAAHTLEDKEMHKEAVELLKKLG
ncbi:regulator of microtubule dynamics protein 1 [Genypterus blacodes]|uniref:regulator of microtubule dynamics protein 1 n=1 Tax=Genypterus blacodes TaxID=154954 RepID=UPI003F76087C